MLYGETLRWRIIIHHMKAIEMAALKYHNNIPTADFVVESLTATFNVYDTALKFDKRQFIDLTFIKFKSENKSLVVVKVCGDIVLENGVHGLSCPKSAGIHYRHRELNNTVWRTLNTVQFPSQLEPPGLFRTDNKRVDGITLVPWSNGQCLTWDVTCSDTLAPSYLQQSSSNCGVIAEKSARSKTRLYSCVTEQNFIFVPIAVESMGPWCQEAGSFLTSLGRLLSEKTGDPRSKSFLFQRIGLTVQRGNAISIMGTLPMGKKLDEIYEIL